MELESNLKVKFCWAARTIIITTIVCLSIISGLCLVLTHDDLVSRVISLIIALSLFSLISFTPISLCLNRDEIVLRKMIGRLKIQIKEVESIELMLAKNLKGANRIIGSSGYFGYWGYFRSNCLGKFTLFATEKNNLILIKTVNGKKYVFNLFVF